MSQVPWTRRYPAITVAALAGTVVGAPGGVAAAMSISGGLTAARLPAAGVANPLIAVGPVVGLGRGTAPAPRVSAPATVAPSPTASPSPPAPIYPFSGTTLDEVEPTGLYGGQSSMYLNQSQWTNAVTIVSMAQRMGVTPYAAVIALATAMQESRLENLTVAMNADSLGLFQQRPSMGWGTAAQLVDPEYASRAFLSALLTYAPNYQSMDLWEAAQTVQQSAYPTAYAQWQAQAAQILLQISTGNVPVAVPTLAPSSPAAASSASS